VNSENTEVNTQEEPGRENLAGWPRETIALAVTGDQYALTNYGVGSIM
jgi:hypothetical protein